jgi:hypothetical protein
MAFNRRWESHGLMLYRYVCKQLDVTGMGIATLSYGAVDGLDPIGPRVE